MRSVQRLQNDRCKTWQGSGCETNQTNQMQGSPNRTFLLLPKKLNVTCIVSFRMIEPHICHLGSIQNYHFLLGGYRFCLATCNFRLGWYSSNLGSFCFLQDCRNTAFSDSQLPVLFTIIMFLFPYVSLCRYKRFFCISSRNCRYCKSDTRSEPLSIILGPRM